MLLVFAKVRSRVGPVTLIVSLCLLLIAAGLAWLHDPRPKGETGIEADSLARRVAAASDDAGWRRTGAVAWTFAANQHHLWDRRRQLVEVRWDKMHVMIALRDHRHLRGVAFRGGALLKGEACAGAVRKAYAHWINDSFWLNPFEKFFDPGVRRQLVKAKGRHPGLLVSYTQGGLTPGDAYLFRLTPRGAVHEWKMWVSQAPYGGVSATWEDWVRLPTGARVATLHRVGPLSFRLTNLEAAGSLAKLRKSDPFHLLKTKDGCSIYHVSP